jgi:ribonuclease T1
VSPKAARIIAVVVIAMLVLTLAASLFGCSASKAGSDPGSGITVVAVEHN